MPQLPPGCLCRALIRPGCGDGPRIPGRRLCSLPAAFSPLSPPARPPPVQVEAHEPVPPVSPGCRPGGYRPLPGSLLRGGGGSGGRRCRGGGAVHQGCHMALRGRGRPPVLGTIGAPAPHSSRVVYTCRASWAQGRGWGLGGGVFTTGNKQRAILADRHLVSLSPWGLPPPTGKPPRGGGGGGSGGRRCRGGGAVHQGCHMALRERGRPPVLGTVGAPAPHSSRVVYTCRASWAQGRGWRLGGGVLCRRHNCRHRGRGGGGGQQKPPSLFLGPQRGASPRPAPSLCGG